MIRLTDPASSFEETLDACVKGILRKPSLKERIKGGKGQFSDLAIDYSVLAASGELFTIKPLSHIRGVDPIVVAGLTKKELVNLYEYYFRNDEKPGRAIYDELLASSNEKCPFCGGIGTPKNLDHYMPKAHFPQFCVLPVNLVPSCRDCNMDGKGQSYAISAEEQVIHPYLDDDRFFCEQWIFAKYIPGTPGVIEYSAVPPEDWSETNKTRAQQHFSDFDLAKRYGREAASHLSELMPQINSLLSMISIEDIKQNMLHPVVDAASFANHWKRAMYLALIDAPTFY